LKDIDYNVMNGFAGFSDHTIGIEAAKKAMDIGIEYIEIFLFLSNVSIGSHKIVS
jgi:sialic acid synthase SpsE